MALVNRDYLVANLTHRVDSLLASQLVDEFVSCERRFIQRDWEPAELDGGQFAEVAARIWYAEDSGNVNLSKGLDQCLRYIANDQVSHLVSPRKTAIHVSRVLRTIYKFRSDRGAVHISPTYQANHMDAKIVIECVRWCMNEMVRYFWPSNPVEVATVIREILQFDVPAIGSFEDVLIVQRVDLSPEEELLILLHYSGDEGMSRRDLGVHAMLEPPQVTRALKKLASKTMRQIVKLGTGQYRLTDIGSKRIREELAEKLLVG